MNYKIPQFTAIGVEQNKLKTKLNRTPSNTVFSNITQSPSPVLKSQSQSTSNLIKQWNNQIINGSSIEKDPSKKPDNRKQDRNTNNCTNQTAILKTWNFPAQDLNKTKVQGLTPVKQSGLPVLKGFLENQKIKDQLVSNNQTPKANQVDLFFQLGQIKVNQSELRNASSSSRYVSNRTSIARDVQQRSPSVKRQNIKQISSGYFMQSGSQMKDNKEIPVSQQVIHSFNPEQYKNCLRYSNEGESSIFQEQFEELDLQTLPEPERSIPTMYSSNDIRLDTFNGNQSIQKDILKNISTHQFIQFQKQNNDQKYYHTDYPEKKYNDRIEILILNRDKLNQIDQPIVLETTTNDKTKLIEELQQFFNCHTKNQTNLIQNNELPISQNSFFSDPQKISKYNHYIKIENLEQSLQNIQKNNCTLKSHKQQQQQEGDSISTLNSLSVQSFSHQVEGKIKEDELKCMLKLMNQEQLDLGKSNSFRKKIEIQPPISSRKVSQTQFDYNTKDLLVSNVIQKFTATPRQNQTTVKKNKCNGRSPLLAIKDKKLNNTADFKKITDFNTTNKQKIQETVYSPIKNMENSHLRKDLVQKKRGYSQSSIIQGKLSKH